MIPAGSHYVSYQKNASPTTPAGVELSVPHIAIPYARSIFHFISRYLSSPPLRLPYMSTWIKVTIGVVVFFGAITGYVLEIPHLGTYLDLGSLIKTGVIGGAVVGGVYGYILQKSGSDQDNRFSIFAGVLVFGIVLGPLVLSLLNRNITSDSRTEEFELLSIKPVMDSRFGVIEGEEFDPNAHMIQFSNGEETYQIKVQVAPEQLKDIEESILLKVASGGLGYRYIEQIESATPYRIAALPDCYMHRHL